MEKMTVFTAIRRRGAGVVGAVAGGFSNKRRAIVRGRRSTACGALT
jgi:hypothetical protein